MSHKALCTAIDNAIVASVHLTPHLGENPPPASAPFREALLHYGGQPCPALDVWVAWRGVQRLVAAYAEWLAEFDPAPTGGRAKTMQ